MMYLLNLSIWLDTDWLESSKSHNQYTLRLWKELFCGKNLSTREAIRKIIKN